LWLPKALSYNSSTRSKNHSYQRLLLQRQPVQKIKTHSRKVICLLGAALGQVSVKNLFLAYGCLEANEEHMCLCFRQEITIDVKLFTRNAFSEEF